MIQLSCSTRPLTVGRAHQTEAFESLIPAVAPEKCGPKSFRRLSLQVARKSGVYLEKAYEARIQALCSRVLAFRIFLI